MNKRLIRDIGFAIESNNMRSFLDRQTLEVITLPGDDIYYDEQTVELVETMDSDTKRYIEIDPVDTRTSFRVMESFAEYQSEGFFRQQLIYALNGKHPFGRFKGVVNSNEDLRQQWFKHKDEAYAAEAIGWMKRNEIKFDAPGSYDLLYPSE